MSSDNAENDVRVTDTENATKKLRSLPKRVVARQLRLAAKKIEAHGWRQHAYGNKEFGFCSVGAILATEDYLRQAEAEQAMRLYIKQQGGPWSVIRWNDEWGRTKKEVLSMFRRVARALEHGWDF